MKGKHAKRIKHTRAPSSSGSESEDPYFEMGDEQLREEMQGKFYSDRNNDSPLEVFLRPPPKDELEKVLGFPLDEHRLKVFLAEKRALREADPNNVVETTPEKVGRTIIEVREQLKTPSSAARSSIDEHAEPSNESRGVETSEAPLPVPDQLTVAPSQSEKPCLDHEHVPQEGNPASPLPALKDNKEDEGSVRTPPKARPSTPIEISPDPSDARCN